MRRRFLTLPWKLYRDDPNWIPPLRRNQIELAGFCHHPFYDDAECQTFLAYRGSEAVGRIAAIVNHAHNRYYNERRGMFGFLEMINDQSVGSALMQAARQWLERRGMTGMRGPVNPSFNYECGLLVEGFDSPPTFMMTYNPPHYGHILERCGLVKAQDLYAYYGHIDMLDTMDPKVRFVAEEATRRFHVSLRKLDPRHFDRDIRAFLRIYNQSLPGTWGFVPLSERELQHAAAGLRHLIVPQMTSIAEVNGEPVGAVFGLLDYNPLIREIDGRLFPFGFLRILWGRKKITRVRMLSTNVLPQYQRWGLAIVMMGRLIPEAVQWGIVDAEFSWVLESNQLSRGTLERGGAKRIKTYRIYDWQWN